MIKIVNLQKYHGKKKVLHEVSLEIKKGEVFGLLGANGAGKSTLLSVLATIASFSTGSVTIDKFDLKKQTKNVRELIGYVPQEIALWEELTVKENMFFWSRLAKKNDEENKLKQICASVCLTDKWNEKVSNLSGGMKRKLNMAIALIHDPLVLLMDEPTTGIDLQSKLEISQYMKTLASEGKTIVYTTHDVSEIMFLCDRVGVLSQGSFQFIGTLQEAQKYLMQKGIQATDEKLIYELLKNDN